MLEKNARSRSQLFPQGHHLPGKNESLHEYDVRVEILHISVGFGRHLEEAVRSFKKSIAYPILFESGFRIHMFYQAYICHF